MAQDTATLPASPRTATIRDVALAAGVSVATVSRVLNSRETVKPDTAELVLEAARTLGFRPNLLGRNLRATRTHTIGAMLPALNHPVFSECLQYLELAARERGQGLAIASTGYDAAAEEAVSEGLLQRRVDGLILTVADASRSPLLDKLDAEQLPYVLVFNQIETAAPARDAGRPCVAVDNRRAAGDMTRHLIGLGHRRIRMLAGQFRQSDRSRQRFDGYRAAMQQAGLRCDEPLELPFDASDTRGVLHQLLAQRDRPTALFCSNDHLALTVIRDLRAMGYRVPDDISVAGFDGVAVGDCMTPALTTVAQPMADIGRTAVALLLQRIAGDAAVGTVVLPHSLRAGGTAQAPAG